MDRFARVEPMPTVEAPENPLMPEEDPLFQAVGVVMPRPKRRLPKAKESITQARPKPSIAPGLLKTDTKRVAVETAPSTSSKFPGPNGIAAQVYFVYYICLNGIYENRMNNICIYWVMMKK